MEIIPAQILLAATQMAKWAGLQPEQTMALVFRALDHPMAGAQGERFIPARTVGIGRAIYAALFCYPVALVQDAATANGWRWQAQIPEYGYALPFEQMFIQAQLIVSEQRGCDKRDIQSDIKQNARL